MKNFEEVKKNTQNVFIQLIERQFNKDKFGIEFIQKVIELLFESITNTENLQEADLIFDNLEVIHLALSKVYFTTDLQVNPFLKEFIHGFERIDDDNVRKYQYQKIKFG
ncbi:MAG: hypothetical protein LBS01_07430 [Prevotellaceae bacterium]|jgi:hypothetical protein|nr:hypothetical protein [Prevotellaceae bacterium]